MASTLLLDAVTWDWIVDSSGNWAVADEPYSFAQDAASAIRLKLGELYYDVSVGVPYDQILGVATNIPLLKASLVAAALTVPGVVKATVFLTSIADRTVNGQVQITTSSGQTVAAPISFVPPIAPVSGPSLDFSNPDNSQYLPGL